MFKSILIQDCFVVFELNLKDSGRGEETSFECSAVLVDLKLLFRANSYRTKSLFSF